MNLEQIELRAEKALAYLLETDDDCAELKFKAALAEHSYKAQVDARFLVLEGAVEVRKAQARVAAEGSYVCYLEAQRVYDAMKMKRDRELAVLDWMRSIYSYRKMGA